MRLLVSGSTTSVGRRATEWPDRLGHLLTPGNGNAISSLLQTGLSWAIDNGAYSGFDPVAFRRLLGRAKGQPRLLWIVCPDVVADAAGTLALFEQWRDEVAAHGPAAFVGQDGQELLPVPWDRFACLFIGGSTSWKIGPHAFALAAEAKQRGKWVHMGRVNSRRRLEIAAEMGCDSVDGSSASRFGETYIDKYIRWMAQIERQQLLSEVWG